MKFIAGLFLLALMSVGAHAQSNCGYVIQGRVLTAAQWNFCFGQKQDALGFAPLNVAGGTLTGKLNLKPSSASSAGLNFGQGGAPTTPVNGDVWITSAGMYVRANGSTVGPLGTGGGGSVSSFNTRTGAVVPTTGDYTPAQVGLGSVTNDVQAKASIWPNTAMNGDCTLSGGSAITCTKTNSVVFAASATTDATNASNISSGTLAAARNTSIASSTVLGNFSGSTVAASAQAVPTCANDGVHALTNNAGGGFNCVNVSAAGFHVLASVRLATTGALSNSPTYNNGTSGVGATLTAGSNGALTIDGVTVSVSDRVLIKDQATTLQNGVYTVTTAGSVGAAYVLTRATDADQPTEVSTAYALVTAGSTNVSSGWVSSSVTTIGTDSVSYSQFSASSGVASFNGRSGVVTPQSGDYTASLVGLGSVTNDAQAKASIWPNSAPTQAQVAVGVNGGGSYAPVSLSGDCVITFAGAITCTKTSGSSFVASATTDTTNAANISSGTLNCSRLPSQTGDVTTSGCASALANIPTATPLAGFLNTTNVVAPATPASGHTDVYVDSTQKVLSAKNDAGTVSITVVPSTAPSNQFANGVSAAGVLAYAQPAFSNISGSVIPAQGGTGITTYTLGDTIYASAINTMSVLSGNTTTTTKYMQQVGNGSTSQAPSWAQVSLTAGVAGTLPVGSGGTGATSFTANAPVIGNGGSALGVGSRSGNTTTFATASGTLTNLHCVQIDSSGNFVDAGGPCTTGGGGGTVLTGTANQLAFYQSGGTIVQGLSTGNNGVLVTSGAGAPSVSSTLPASLNVPAPTLQNSSGTTVCTIGSNTYLTCTGLLATTATLNPQSGDYTIASGDCGKVVLESGAFKTITLPSTSGFAADCVVQVRNVSKTRAQVLSGFPGPMFFCNTGCLWPQQSITVWNNAGTWTWVSTLPQRYYPDLAAQSITSPTLYVAATSCSDNNDGLTSGAALCTMTQAYSILQSQFDSHAHNPHIVLGAGTFTENFLVSGQGVHMSDGVSVSGQGSGTVVTSLSGNTLEARDFGILFVNNVTLECSTSGRLIEASQFGIVDVGAGGTTTVLSDCASGVYLAAEDGGRINITGNLSINIDPATDPAYVFYASDSGSKITLGASTMTCVTNIAVTSFAQAAILGQIDANNFAFSGCSGVTGKRYSAISNSVITGTGAVSTFFPGNVSGTVSGGGIYQ